MQVAKLTPAQVWGLYVEKVRKDPNAIFELPTIRSLEELERMDEVELIKLWQELKRYAIEDVKQNLAAEFLSLVETKRKTGAEYYREKQAQELKEAFARIEDAFLYRYVFAVKRARKSLYYIIYTTYDITSMNYRELSDFAKAIFQKVLELSRKHAKLEEFTIYYNDILVIAEKFSKTDIQIISKGELLSINDILARKREKAEKKHKLKRSAFVVERAISDFFAFLFP